VQELIKLFVVGVVLDVVEVDRSRMRETAVDA
jgi:hypothetical protein